MFSRSPAHVCTDTHPCGHTHAQELTDWRFGEGFFAAVQQHCLPPNPKCAAKKLEQCQLKYLEGGMMSVGAQTLSFWRLLISLRIMYMQGTKERMDPAAGDSMHQYP
mmetsp:Transcript_6710/g.14642  ORF Transcript_6710/g.14642 Transcript_6710/m.14642 type:complete len:107 (+) Transcript_6710:163-483(+)